MQQNCLKLDGSDMVDQSLRRTNSLVQPLSFCHHSPSFPQLFHTSPPRTCPRDQQETGSLPEPAPNSLAGRELGNQPRVPLFLLPGRTPALKRPPRLATGRRSGRVARLQPGFLFSQTPAACCLASQLRVQRARSAFSVSSLPARPRSQGRMLRGCEPHWGCVASKPHGLLVGSGTDPLVEEISAPRAGLLNVPQGPRLGPPLLPPDAPHATSISQGCILEDGPSCGEGGPNVHRRHRQDQG